MRVLWARVPWSNTEPSQRASAPETRDHCSTEPWSPSSVPEKKIKTKQKTIKLTVLFYAAESTAQSTPFRSFCLSSDTYFTMAKVQFTPGVVDGSRRKQVPNRQSWMYFDRHHVRALTLNRPQNHKSWLTEQGHHNSGDDTTYCARIAFTHLELWRKLYDCSLHHFTTCQCILKCVRLIFSTTSNWLAEIWKGGLFDPRFGG